MLKIEGLKLSLDHNDAQLTAKAASVLNIAPSQIKTLRILRRSIDARETVSFVYTVIVETKGEQKLLQRCHSPQVSLYQPEIYRLPVTDLTPSLRPVVIGAGPAGLFAALLLARCGARPILLEQGQAVEQRKRDVEQFWSTGELNITSNVQFGEGGAGTFSDGKLTTGTRDIRHGYILQNFVDFGADPDILINSKPHIGTDRLYIVLQNMRRELLSLGAEIRFGHKLIGLEHTNGHLSALKVVSGQKEFSLPARHAILALGHSARDSFEFLRTLGIEMEAKPFAVGVRIEHRQKDIDAAQYKMFASHPALPPSSYKLSTHTKDGRGVFSFCVCPGGEVVAAASEKGHLVTNGMSRFARDRENINGGLLVSVTPEDFNSADILAGIAFQRKLERDAFLLGGKNFFAPAQTVGDFLLHRPSSKPGNVLPSYRPGVRWCDLHDCLPNFICQALEEALPVLASKIQGFAAPQAVLTAVETRSSSPIRILRDKTYQSSLAGLYPCGEGAGYAGGIMSAAADGMRCAEFIIKELQHER